MHVPRLLACVRAVTNSEATDEQSSHLPHCRKTCVQTRVQTGVALRIVRKLSAESAEKEYRNGHGRGPGMPSAMPGTEGRPFGIVACLDEFEGL